MAIERLGALCITICLVTLGGMNSAAAEPELCPNDSALIEYCFVVGEQLLPTYKLQYDQCFQPVSGGPCIPIPRPVPDEQLPVIRLERHDVAVNHTYLLEFACNFVRDIPPYIQFDYLQLGVADTNGNGFGDTVAILYADGYLLIG